ncbi:class I lanthipeptide [Chitinophaga nivalis]|uniref:Class I lanthipeptide n=1 Tax=Chitinophaga nivalis TaxID=2991709 RepID=A0ABT3IL93_9BACT|nr:class I lanthipeptide [Chitinophaga nivalis]MCW3465565.1 class I lanthipeptide [Chitinophaga nivalis]MCW3484744.1 class I lanthipeptide [Chitinophaga nivalis]
MKKKKIALDKHLFLDQTTITALHADEQQHLAGGWLTKTVA